MIEDDEVDAEAMAWGEWLKQPTSPTPEDARELRMMAKLLGSKTEADRLANYTRTGPIDPNRAPSGSLPPRLFRHQPPRLEFVYWETAGIWRIERFENGRKIHCHDGGDFERRDRILLKLQHAGYKCTPVTVSDTVPTPIRRRYDEKPKAASAKATIMQQLAGVTSADVRDFTLRDYELEE